MIKFTEDQLAVIEILGYTPKLIKDENGESKLLLDWGILSAEQIGKINMFFREKNEKDLINKNDI